MKYLFSELILLLGSIYLYWNSPTYMDSTFIIIALVIAALSIFVHIRSRKKQSFTIGHVFIFIAGYSIVFFQYNIDYVLGLTDNTDSYIWYDTKVVCKAICLADIALCCFFIGYFLYRKNHQNKNCRLNIITKKKFAIYTTFILYIIYLLTVNPRYLFGGYLIYNEGHIASFVNTLILSSLIAVFILYVIDFQNNNYINRKDFLHHFKYPLLLASIYIITILISGRRTEAVKTFLLMLISYLYIYKIGKKVIFKLVFFVLIMSSVFAIRSMTREISGHASFNSSIKNLKESETIMPLTKDLAFNVSSLHIIMSYYPQKINYNYGITFFPGFLVLIPGTQQFFYQYFDIPPQMRGSDWITTVLASDESFGLGTSIVADAYVSFGPIGVVIIFLILGAFLNYIEYNTFIDKKKSTYFLALSFSTYISLIYACRGSVGYLFANLTYTLIFLWLFTYNKKSRYKSSI